MMGFSSLGDSHVTPTTTIFLFAGSVWGRVGLGDEGLWGKWGRERSFEEGCWA